MNKPQRNAGYHSGNNIHVMGVPEEEKRREKYPKKYV